jgi:hypothetical protein
MPFLTFATLRCMFCGIGCIERLPGTEVLPFLLFAIDALCRLDWSLARLAVSSVLGRLTRTIAGRKRRPGKRGTSCREGSVESVLQYMITTWTCDVDRLERMTISFCLKQIVFPDQVALHVQSSMSTMRPLIAEQDGFITCPLAHFPNHEAIFDAFVTVMRP